MSEPNFSAIRARLRYQSMAEFIEGYGRYVTRGGMFVPMSPQKLKPVGTTVRFQFQLADGTSAMLGEGIVRQLKGVEDPSQKGSVGMLVKFTKLSPDTKELVDRIVERKSGAKQIPKEFALERDTDRQRQETPRHGAQAIPREAQEQRESDTGVIEASTVDQLRSQVRPDGQPEQDELSEPHTTEMTLPADDQELADDVEPAASGDEVFGDSGAHSLGDDPSVAVAEALAEASSEAEVVDEQEPAEEQPATVDEATPFGDDDFFDELVADSVAADSGAAMAGEQASEARQGQSQALPDGSTAPAEEAEPSPQDGGPKALKETEGGIKVMAFEDDDDVDDLLTKEFEEFASGSEEEEFDAMFDNVFGGGGDALFGDGDEGGDDPFAAPATEQEVADELPVQQAAPEPAQQERSDEALEMPAQADESPASEPALELAPEEPDSLHEQSEEPFELVDEAADSATSEEAESAEGDSSERIRSLLTMEEESEEPEMVLNLGGDSLEEESSEAEEEGDPDDSMESLLASAQKEIEKKAEEKEQKERDILDELIGDDELPPPPGGPSTLNVPQPKGTKKKKGFISKIFGDKD